MKRIRQPSTDAVVSPEYNGANGGKGGHEQVKNGDTVNFYKFGNGDGHPSHSSFRDRSIQTLGDLTSSRNEMERLGWVFEDYDGNVCLPSEFYGAHAISRRYIPGGNPNHNDFGTLGLYGDSSQTYANGDDAAEL